MAADLQTLINAIPAAREGDEITPEYHNSVRDALRALAATLGAAGPRTITLSPLLNAKAGVAGTWRLAEGVASASGAGKSITGFIPVSLPDGTEIRSVTVRGSRTGDVDGFEAKLVRQPLERTDLLTVAFAALEELPAGDYQQPLRLQAGANALRVDNSRFKYFFVATVDNPANSVSLSSIQFEVA